MLNVIVNYSEYDNKITEATIPLSPDYIQVIKIKSIPADPNDPTSVESSSVEIQTVETLTDTVVSSKEYTRLELSAYIKLLQRLQREAVNFN